MYQDYINTIRLNLNIAPEYMYFKRDISYNAILEHVSIVLGYDYLRYIQNEFNDLYTINKEYLIKLAIDNDKYGRPNKNEFYDFTNCSATNLRYIYHSFLILDYMKKNNLNNVNIIEIGGGYGGLCYYIHNMAHLYNISISSYVIFDLVEACQLQKKYLSLFNININTGDINTTEDYINLNKNSFLISNYAFSEISMEYQNLYKTRILDNYIDYGFLVWNSYDKYNFIENKDIKYEIERPQTGTINSFVYIKPLD